MAGLGKLGKGIASLYNTYKEPAMNMARGAVDKAGQLEQQAIRKAQPYIDTGIDKALPYVDKGIEGLQSRIRNYRGKKEAEDSIMKAKRKQKNEDDFIIEDEAPSIFRKGYGENLSPEELEYEIESVNEAIELAGRVVYPSIKSGEDLGKFVQFITAHVRKKYELQGLDPEIIKRIMPEELNHILRKFAKQYDSDDIDIP